jgi:hypothetical protein
MFHVERIFNLSLLRQFGQSPCVRPKRSVIEEPLVKARYGFLRIALLLFVFMLTSCITQRGTVSVGEYVLVPHGKTTLGNEQGLTAFIFENNQRKRPFVQFVSDKYGVGVYEDVQYSVDLESRRFTVYVYENDELNKYFDMTQFISTMGETQQNIIGSNARFIGLSITDDHNQDCLADGSLYKNIATTYLTNLKHEFYNQ